MPSLRDAIGESVRNFMCSAASNSDPFRNWFAQSTSSVPGVGAAAAAADNLGDAVAGLVCPGPSGGSSGGGGAGATYPVAEPEIGQCEVGYRYSWIYEYVDSSGNARNTGPSGTPNFDPFQNPRPGPLSRPAPRPERPTEWVVRDGSGFLNNIAFLPLGGTFTYDEWYVQRVDGLPDDCGETPLQQPPTGSDDITYDGPDGIPVTEPITINPTFPIIGPGGTLYMPIEVCLAAICFDVNLNISTGDITFNFGGKPETSPCCPPFEDLSEDGDEDDPPPPENDVRYVAVVTKVVDNAESCSIQEIGNGQGPTLLLPRAGVVRFAIELGGRRSWTVDQAIKQRDQVTYVNAPGAAYDWTILPERGFDIEVTGVPVVA